MDKGAHFYKCDLRVHTPRDRNWTGAEAVSEEERKSYAKEFIQACRDKGLDAVAITDHHDLAFYKYIKEAAETEVEANGELIPENERIIVFPGVELTLALPCQAILLLDADFPLAELYLVLTALAIAPAPDSDAKHTEIELLGINEFVELYEVLDRHETIKGRYIILPHVKPNGYKTLLRHGFQAHYANSPCVGGYLDGSIDSLGEGDEKILNGEVQAWGNKALGVIQTSDNRYEDHQL